MHTFSPLVKPSPLTVSVALVIFFGTHSKAETVREKSLQLLIQNAKPHDKPPSIESRAKPPRLKAALEEEPDVVKLPEVKVEAKRITALDASLAFTERQQRWEEKAFVPSALDSFLNKLPLFGGSTAEARAARARQRVDIMDSERLLLISLTLAKTPEERERLLADIEMLKELRR